MKCIGCGRDTEKFRCKTKQLCRQCYALWWYSLPGNREKQRRQNRRYYDRRINRKKCGYQQRALWTIWSLLGGYNQYARILTDLQRITDAADDDTKWGYATRQEWRARLKKSGCRELAEDEHA